jgi:adenylate cyclase
MENASEWVAAHVMFSVISVGLALILLLAQDRTRTNVALATLFALLGTLIPLTVALALEVYPYDRELAARITGLLEAAVMVVATVYFSGLAATAQKSARAERLSVWTIRCGYALAAWHVVATLLFPAQRLHDFSQTLFQQGDAYDRPGFWLFAGTWILTAGSFGLAYFVLFRQQIDPAERDRALTTLFSGPILVFTIFLPVGPATLVALVSMLAAVLSQVRYNVLRGREGAFLSRFLSDQVADLVRTAGLAEVMRPHEVELTVVACDLRGFTAYAEAVPSQAVIDLLN